MLFGGSRAIFGGTRRSSVFQMLRRNPIFPVLLDVRHGSIVGSFGTPGPVVPVACVYLSVYDQKFVCMYGYM